jgi:hypothetical protein
MTGGNIDAIADLVYRDVPMIDGEFKSTQENKVYVNVVPKDSPPTEDTITWNEMNVNVFPNKHAHINVQWRQYIKFNEKFTAGHITYSFKAGIDPNQHNSRGQTLLFLAAQNCNKQMIDALVAMGVRLTDINSDGSTILHGIAWGKVNDQGQPIKTYDEKVAFMIDILGRYPIETIPLLFRVNQRGETCYDNLLMRHPDKISKSLEDVAFPLGWKREKNPNDETVYINPRDNIGYLKRPY